VKDKVNYKGLLLTQIAEVNLPLPDQYEYKFMDSRDWRFDYAWTDLKVAIEYNGIRYSKTKGNIGRTGHTTIVGVSNDYEKIGEAQIRNWIVIVTNPILVRDYITVDQLARAILKRKKSRVRYLESKKNV